MLPIEILNPKSIRINRFLCISTQRQPKPLNYTAGWNVIGNEPVAGRVNLLVTNTQRLGLHNVIICKHDGRSIGRIPKPGADYVVCDVPCSGTATTRKTEMFGLIGLQRNLGPCSMYKLALRRGLL